MSNNRAAVIGGGPAGLMAAETLAAQGIAVDLYDAMPSVGRKFLLAGKGGMNLTHSEARELFHSRYGKRRTELEPLLNRFGAAELRSWAAQLGINTFVGSSGRVFPTDMKAAPLLRSWLHRLREAGVSFHMRHRWRGWNEDGALLFDTPDGAKALHANATVLALGGASWARLGSDGAWVEFLAARGIELATLRPANCGFEIAWTRHMRERFAGQPLKSIVLRYIDADGVEHRRQGECVLTEHGLEGSLIYAMSSGLRDALDAKAPLEIRLDLAPGWTEAKLAAEIAHPRGSRSMASHLQSRVNIAGVKAALLHEVLGKEEFADAVRVAKTIKSLPLSVTATRPIDEAISSAGGVRFEAMDEHLMLRELPGVFCAGEMLDWEAPTGGYLLTACFTTGSEAGQGAATWLKA
ncbi:MAG: TIGR03862 family flavoprotein [Burkholderiaceae bacterium]|nr:TIGR03862 family flavoprotein [Burkholderiaceae bacterium]